MNVCVGTKCNAQHDKTASALKNVSLRTNEAVKFAYLPD